jgi:hypothetical protein
MDSEAERYAKLVREMIDQPPWCDKPDARVALAIAARAILRGRHLTEAEKLRNLANAMEADDVDDGLDMGPFATSLRRAADKLEVCDGS